MEIRFAGPADADALHALITALAIYEREPDAVKPSAADLREQLASPRPPFECLLAEAAGQPIGFALFYQTYSTWEGRAGIHLEDLFVPESERGRGIGKALLAALARLCEERGHARLEWQVLDWNKPAIGFYDSLGARPMADWITYRLSGSALADLAAEA